MSLPKLLVFLTIIIFGSIAIAAYLKGNKEEYSETLGEMPLEPIELELPEEEPEQVPGSEAEMLTPDEMQQIPQEPEQDEFQHIDRVQELFNTYGKKLPIVHTVSYTSRVPWLKGRAAWIVDYASHYKTSRHFIARSLNGKADYDNQNVSQGQKFNVLNPDKNIEFYLVIDLLSSKMRFYYIDIDTNERVLLKTYLVGLGRFDPDSPSGSLTPIGKYALGNKVTTYRPKTMGNYHGEKTEMVRVFGTRWIPFSEEIGDCSAPAKGLGLHGLPLQPNDLGKLAENRDTLGKYESDGCIRLATDDIEELFSIIITRPTVVEIVRGFSTANPPGKEVAID